MRRSRPLSFSSFSQSAIIIALLVPTAGMAQQPFTAKHSVKAVRPVLEANVRAEMERLAGDAMLGRGSGTVDELRAGEYIASQFKKFGVEPAGDKDANGKPGYLQTVALTKQEFAAAPVLSLGEGGAAGFWTGIHGKEIAVLRAGGAKISGPLQKLQPGGAVKRGAIVYIHLGEGKSDPPVRAQLTQPISQGAAAVVVADAEQIRKRFLAAAKEVPELPTKIGDGGPGFRGEPTIVLLDAEATKHFDQAAEGSTVQLTGELKGSEPAKTWNVVGTIKGESDEAVLLTAHMDHIGVDPKLQGDKIFNGADDDASGVTAVLEMARALGSGLKPKRTIYFVTFGSEEKGGFGAQYFLQDPPVPLTRMAANLEFEMIGRPDSAVEAQTLWLTGFDRTNLGPELAKHGARLVADPHPAEQFFTRSDNYALALKGVVAQTVSSFGLHKDYHQVSDDIAHIDFKHMTRAIDSMVKPIVWLVNSDFKPQWNEGKKPTP